ncbi:Tripartite tricarboxylate transporter family receptor [Pigmentiphaga humi]|uniref:Tripartite tricarboxylate transporter family receptor n=1 Tax=Pigmentiphaga humi TaxID=2478468 RepID=A0A3P4B1N4_9BURK|nr:tripartite tricarboxylate transporter substrate-binding protein [Pigmentiphaga humi]VCU69558.1 Tripartite tricarboxylate transporter family receptor [Pigmentiphaga humi]
MNTFLANMLGRGALALAGLPAWPAHASGQDFPKHPVRVIVPFAAGTSPDVVIRIVGQKLSDMWSQQLVVENRPGAGGGIGATAVAQAQPDGYTLLYTINSILCANPHLYAKLGYDPFKSFVPVSLVVNLGYVLLARKELEVRNVAELIAYAKKHPGKLTYGSAGNGSGNHIVMELLTSMTGTSMLHVPMNTSKVLALLSGQTDLAMEPYTNGVAAAKDGKVRGLAVTLANRSENLPDVPTIGETVPGYVGDAWHALLAPAGTPPAIAEKISADVAKVLAMPDVRQRLAAASLEPVGSTPAELGAIVRKDYDKWGAVIREANIRLD